MPPLAPGIFVEENQLPRRIEGVESSTAALVGAARRGATGRPRLVSSFLEFTRYFGALRSDLELGYAVLQFFANGGRRAWIVRTARSPTPAQWARALKALPRPEVTEFGLLVLPGVTDPAVWVLADTLANVHRAFLVLDAPRGADTIGAMTTVAAALPTWPDAAIYFPWVQVADPASAGATAMRLSAPSGSMAGVIARTDLTRGLWKAPAGMEATLLGVGGLALHANAADADGMNRERVNCLREFPARGLVVFGARTLAGADASGSEWKYVPVRRLGRHVQRSVERGLAWAVFEPNDDRLWGQVRGAVEEFLTTCWREGALAGAKPAEAFFVRCDRTTMTASDLAAGRLKVIIGLAPLKPAEFVLVRVELATLAA